MSRPKPDQIIGRTIVAINAMSQARTDELSWSNRPVMLVLDNGTNIYATSDEEGNDGGCLNYITIKGKEYSLFPEQPKGEHRQ